MGKRIPALRYLWKIYSVLPGGWKQKKRILTGIQSCVQDFVEENPDADYQAIAARFGSPEQIAKNAIYEMEAEDILELLRVRYKIVHIVLATATLVALIWFGYTTRMYSEHVNDVNGYATIEIEVIEDNRTDEGGY